VVEWPTPTSLKQLQRFLDFANFYRRLIRDYSRIAAPLTKLTSPVVPFSWTPKAGQAFAELKERFTSAPILVHPDPSRQFIMEVDASDTGVGVVLSQCSGSDQKLHPCAFLSRHLSPAERNYDVGNRELLAVKLALEEWRHFSGGGRTSLCGLDGPQEPRLHPVSQAPQLASGSLSPILWAVPVHPFLPPTIPPVHLPGGSAQPGHHPPILLRGGGSHLGDRDAGEAGPADSTRPR